MGFKYFLVLYGVVEFIFGVYICISKNVTILRLLVEGLYGKEELDFDSITLKKEYAKWAGELILVGGAIYTFLASLTLKYDLSSLITFLLILMIELKIFKYIVKGHKRFL